MLTGYNLRSEERKLLSAQCLEFDVMSLQPASDPPLTRGIKDLMCCGDQSDTASTGYGMTTAAAVAFYIQTGVWRQFNPLWTYRHAQMVSDVQGAIGSTVYGSLYSAMCDGLLPESTYPVVNYSHQFPQVCYAKAYQWRIGYSLELKGFNAILRFLQTNQGGVVTGGAWGNWAPNSRGICERFISGSNGRCRAYIDWTTIDGKIHLVEASSADQTYGDNGFSYHTQIFVDSQAQDKNTVTIGVSDLPNPSTRIIGHRPDIPTAPTVTTSTTIPSETTVPVRVYIPDQTDYPDDGN